MTDEDGIQWLSNGTAVYKLEGMPVLDEDTVLTVLGVADDAKDKWYTMIRQDESGLLANDTADEEEITAEDAGISIIYNGFLLTPIYTMSGMLWLDTTLLAPTEKKDMDYRKFFVRTNGEGRCIAVKKRNGINGCHYGVRCVAGHRSFGRLKKFAVLLSSRGTKEGYT